MIVEGQRRAADPALQQQSKYREVPISGPLQLPDRLDGVRTFDMSRGEQD